MNSHELTTFLQTYLRIDTSHPKPDYTSAIKLFEKQARHDGFTTQIIDLPSGRSVLCIHYPAPNSHNLGLSTLALSSHMDVVPAGNTTLWKHDPFSGTIENDILYGRGTQDMKSVGVIQYGALLRLKKSGVKTERSICLLCVPDEEIGGFTGVGELVKTEEFKQLNIGYLLDEGLSSSCQKKIFIKVSERKPIQIKIESSGAMGHGSRLHADNTIHNLIVTLQKFIQLHQTNQEKSLEIPAGLLISANITSLSAGVIHDNHTALNCIPSYANATIDIRIPPNVSLLEAKAMIAQMFNDNSVSYTILAMGEDVPYQDFTQNSLYHHLSAAIEKYNYRAEPYYAQSASDLRFYLNAGIQALGISPFTCQENIHGINESIPLDDLESGCSILFNFLHSFCGETTHD